MPTDSSFPDLMGRVRAGDDAAAAELVRRFEPVIRRTVRIRLRDPRLRRVLDSLDSKTDVLPFCPSCAGSYQGNFLHWRDFFGVACSVAALIPD